MSSYARRFTVLAFLALPLLAGCGGSNPYQGMEPEELYLLGKQKYDEGEWDDAIRPLDRLILGFGNSELVPAARLLMAHAYYAKRDYLTARSEYQRFLDRFPGNPEAPMAALGICRSLGALSPKAQRDQTYTNEAITVCRNVVVDWSGTPQAQEAAGLANDLRLKLAEKEYLNADFYFRRELWDSAIKYFEFVVQLYPETAWAPQALLGIYRSNKAIGYDDLADEARERLLAEYPDSPAAAEVRVDGAGTPGA
ncbi:MAG: putative outer membrane protein assembly factor BamD [Gemmatimonadota bacterium]